MKMKAKQYSFAICTSFLLAAGLSGCTSSPSEEVTETTDYELREDVGELRLQATGNEPFWIAYVYDEQVHYEFMGEAKNEEHIAETITQHNQRTLVFADDRGSLTLWESICHDSMTGMPFPYVAELNSGEAVVAGCGGYTDALLANTQWHVVSIADEHVPEDVSVTLNFGDDGRIYGHSGCNRYFGSYHLTGEGVRFSQMGMTRMACEAPRMELETRFIHALGEVFHLDFDDQNDLALHTSGGDRIRTSRLPRESK